MFGYLKIQKSELLVREFEAYKAVYCGLCRQIGRDYSFLSRLILSYDVTFYAIVLMAVNSSCKGFKNGRCTFNPIKRCKFADCKDSALDKAAAFSVISAYYKLKDNISDCRFFKRLLCRILTPFFNHQRKKAVNNGYGELDALFEELSSAQYNAEHSKYCGIDNSAEPTAVLLAKVFMSEAHSEIQERVFYEFGYNIGRWIYLIDAADDIKDDYKTHSFNPFINCEAADDRNYINCVLSQSLARAYDAYSLMDIVDFKGILDNFMTKGLPLVQKRITENITEEINEKSI